MYGNADSNTNQYDSDYQVLYGKSDTESDSEPKQKDGDYLDSYRHSSAFNIVPDIYTEYPVVCKPLIRPLRAPHIAGGGE
jgi:hypothetical protein